MEKNQKKTLDLKSVKHINGVVDSKPVAKEIKFEIDGVEHEYQVFCKRVSFAQAQEIHNKENFNIAFISACIVDEQGKELFTYEQAGDLQSSLATALLMAVLEVNAPKKKS